MKSSLLCSLALSAISITAGAQTTTEMTDNTLNLRQQHLSALSSLEAKGDLHTLATAIDKALDDSVPLCDIKEAFSQLYAYTGFPRSLNALATLQSIKEQRDAQGKTTVEGTDADPLPLDYDALAQGTEVQTRLRGGTPLNYSFAPATDYYLKAHLFGDIFARNNLTYADRELITVSVLSALTGVEPQLKSHVRGALNLGLPEDQLRSIPLTLREKVGDAEAYRAAKAIADVMGEDFNALPPLAFPTGEPNTAYAQYFVGDSYQAHLATGDGKLPVNNITFTPGCRNNWHIHHGCNQILICVDGIGWYQEWGKPAQKLHPGDVVDIPAEVKHWHGATSDSYFQHIALHTPGDSISNEWLEPVTDKEYQKLDCQE